VSWVGGPRIKSGATGRQRLGNPGWLVGAPDQVRGDGGLFSSPRLLQEGRQIVGGVAARL
jgi:hypothetical protein